MKLSNTIVQEFLDCSKKYDLKRNKKLKPIKMEQSKVIFLANWFISKKIAEKYNLLFNAKKPIASNFKEEAEALQLVEKCDIEAFIGFSTPIAINKDISCNVNGNEISGKIDLLMYNERESMYEIVFWKFGRVTSNADDNNSFLKALLVIKELNIENVKVIKNFIRYNDIRSKVFTKTEIDNFKDYLMLITTEMSRTVFDKNAVVAKASEACATCEMKKYCYENEIVESDIELITESIIMKEAETKRLKRIAKELVTKNLNNSETSRGNWNFTHSEFYALKPSDKIVKSELVKKLIKKYPFLVEEYEFDLKFDDRIAKLCEDDLGISLSKRKTQKFLFKKA